MVLLTGLVFTSVVSAQDLPDKPEILRVSFDSSYQGAGCRLMIEWLPSDSIDVVYYIIYRDDGFGAGIPVDTVSAGITSYQHTLPVITNYKYSVTSYDSNENESLRTPDDYSEHRAVLLTVEYDTCNNRNILTWTPYEGWGDDISQYRVHTIEGCSGEVETTSYDHFTLQHIHPNVRTNECYTYMVEAVRNHDNLVSQSNKPSLETSIPDPPDFVQIDYVDIVDDVTVSITFTADVSGRINDFQLLRSTSEDGDFLVRETLYDLYQSTTTVTDQVTASAYQYFYRIEAIYQSEGCQQSRIVRTSNTGSTILLHGEEENHMVSLSWTPYVEFPGGLQAYVVSRRILDEFVDIAELGPGTTQFNENISSIMNGPQSGEIHYQITAKGQANQNGPYGESHSNIVSIPLETSLYMPNAFTPNGDGNNDMFRPVLDFAPQSFVMIIFDRAGKRLFETSDPYEGWDGSFKGGSRVREGVYVYHVKYKMFTGSIKTLTGSVTVIYP